MKNGKYELIKAPKGYTGKKYRGKYAYEHHIVWWKNTGEILKVGEIIHHRNRNCRDNRFENLEKMYSEDHNRMHSSTGKTYIDLICSHCGKSFRREKRAVFNYKNYYCNRSCMGKAQVSTNLFGSSSIGSSTPLLREGL